jgi:predicted DNA binding CopG/RHH family protein
MKMDADEKELLESVERGEWKAAKGGKRERTRYSRYAKATFRKDRRLNIRLSSKDLEAIQKRALAEGLPYQTLIASLLHKYATGRLKEIWRNLLGEIEAGQHVVERRKRGRRPHASSSTGSLNFNCPPTDSTKPYTVIAAKTVIVITDWPKYHDAGSVVSARR